MVGAAMLDAFLEVAVLSVWYIGQRPCGSTAHGQRDRIGTRDLSGNHSVELEVAIRVRVVRSRARHNVLTALTNIPLTGGDYRNFRPRYWITIAVFIDAPDNGMCAVYSLTWEDR